MHPQPLNGISVIDLTRILAGPYATMLMADLGADVIKVEAPWGDDTRRWGPPWVHEESAYFLSVNRGKRGITLDLAEQQDRDELLRLVGDADVVVESFRTGQLERFGLGFEETLAVRNPRLILASLSGFGRSGPAANLPAYATLIEGMSGLMHVTGDPDSTPTKLGVALVDVLAGLHLLSGVSVALFDRERTGRGRRVDVSLLETALSGLVNLAGSHLLAGEDPGRIGNAHPAIVPFGSFPTRDRDVVITVGNDSQFAAFADLLGEPGLADDPRFATNPLRCEHRAELHGLLVSTLASWDAQELVSAGAVAGVPISLINSVPEAFRDEQAVHLGMAGEMHHPELGSLRHVRHPVSYDGQRPGSQRPPPRLGEHNDELL